MKGQEIGRYDGWRGTTRRNLALAATAAALLLTAVPASTSTATTTTTAAASAACRIDAGAVRSTGDHRSQEFVGTSPATRAHDLNRALRIFEPNQVRLSTQFEVRPAQGYQVMTGHVVIGSVLYRITYPIENGATRPWEVIVDRIGGGWGPFVTLTTSRRVSSESANATDRLYGLRDDGTLYRWTITNSTYRAAAYPGFGAIKTMTLLSRTSTYDTLLLTTRAGALQTVRIPVTAPTRLAVKTVRTSTWQVFENLIGSPCGQSGTLVLGIDKDTKLGYLYAVGHANGSATAIQSLGKVPGTFADPVDFRWAPYDAPPLFGE
ncbi:hypothetical protein AB0L70_07660 [Kribbella sp. NPDC051952]|uniref:hypothetical protein n=1 Tax=Kribbella sp. NPDC051952 TaxID=3154851 RepID=UPI003431250A